MGITDDLTRNDICTIMIICISIRRHTRPCQGYTLRKDMIAYPPSGMPALDVIEFTFSDCHAVNAVTALTALGFREVKRQGLRPDGVWDE